MTEVHDVRQDLTRFRLRVLLAVLAVLVAFGGLAWRLYTLQVIDYEDLEDQAESNRTAVVPIVPARGEILDRNGVVLATNTKAYTLEITPSKLDRPLDQVIDDLGSVVEITPRDRKRFQRLRAGSRGFESVPIKTRLTDQEVARFAAQQYRFPGVAIDVRLFRVYPQGEVASHVIGYVGRINEKEKERIDDSDEEANYRGTDTIGKEGIEAEYEKILHGTTGVEELETRASGYAVRRLARRPAIPGDSVRLTLDLRLQKLVEDMYGDRRGALVAIDPRNGDVLAFVSKPTFDPNLFVEGLDQETWDELNNSPDKPLLDRALRGTFPIGSTYKPFMGLAALQLGFRTPSTTIIDTGSWTFAGHTFRSGEALGAVNLRRAITYSSDVYFYQLANDMGVNTIHDFMKPLGFGQLTGIDLPGERRGVLPSTEWKRKAYRKPAQQHWFKGETISLGIGQGYNNFTMLQLANATATLADGGVRHKPHLLEARASALTHQFVAVPEPPGHDMGYKPQNVAEILSDMENVPVKGTSRAAFAGALYASGGKTGTAQTFSLGADQVYNAKKLKEHLRDHSLYIAFAPADHPTIAVAAIVENAGFGAQVAAPIVRRVLDYWVAGLVPSEEDMKAIQEGKALAPIGTPQPAEALLDASRAPAGR
ncbi:MAG: penicillin-binding protein 2 [Burkholderiaceae bacterium]|nr:MAG: penicillin-binding protein 2 [Burkholderiaceae bacterium]